MSAVGGNRPSQHRRRTTETSLKQPAEGSADGRIEAVMLGTRVVLRLRAQLEFVTLLHREDQFPWLGVQPIRKPEEAR